MSFRILIADDSPPMRRLVCRFLEAVGVGRPVEASSAEETLKLLQAEHFELIILDWSMAGPGNSGLELLRAMRSLDEHASIVIMTTEADEAHISAAMAAGAVEYLIKPFNVEARQRLLELCQQDRPTTLPKINWAAG